MHNYKQLILNLNTILYMFAQLYCNKNTLKLSATQNTFAVMELIYG